MAVAKRTRAGIEIRARRQSALIAGGVTGLCLIAMPVALLELAIASVGLSEIAPVLAPPVGWPLRLLLALAGGLVAAALSAGLGGNGRSGRRPKPSARTNKGNDGMGWTKSLGLHRLARLARGEAAADQAEEARLPGFPKPELVADADALPRRREDLHPDAPPRPPLVASRDLPGTPELTLVETAPVDPAAVDAEPPYVSPVRDTTQDARSRPLPRSPEPLSDADLEWVRAMLAKRDALNRAAPVAAAPEPAAIAPHIDAAQADDGSLLSMLDRFEQGVSRRIALRDSASAIARIDESLPAEGPVLKAVEDAADPVDGPAAIDDALGAALDTLRKLSAKAG